MEQMVCTIFWIGLWWIIEHNGVDMTSGNHSRITTGIGSIYNFLVGIMMYHWYSNINFYHYI